MVDMALKRIKRRMKYRPLGKNLLPDQFTMNELEGLYASFLSKKFDKRNFRRRILEMDFLREIKKFKEILEEEKLFCTNLIQRNIIITPKQGSNHYYF